MLKRFVIRCAKNFKYFFPRTEEMTDNRFHVRQLTFWIVLANAVFGKILFESSRCCVHGFTKVMHYLVRIKAKVTVDEGRMIGLDLFSVRRCKTPKHLRRYIF